MQIVDQAFDSMLNVPAVEVIDLVEQRGASWALCQKALVFSDQIENVLRAGANIRETVALSSSVRACDI